mmetsp:Transcript_24182/g.64684  ORF Transcript_24182/g.64684 Transcript_24182/m.64684 type:complete len:593 (+) Transcript_24182:704-2482(+)
MPVAVGHGPAPGGLRRAGEVAVAAPRHGRAVLRHEGHDGVRGAAPTVERGLAPHLARVPASQGPEPLFAGHVAAPGGLGRAALDAPAGMPVVAPRLPGHRRGLHGHEDHHRIVRAAPVVVRVLAPTALPAHRPRVHVRLAPGVPLPVELGAEGLLPGAPVRQPHVAAWLRGGLGPHAQRRAHVLVGAFAVGPVAPRALLLRRRRPGRRLLLLGRLLHRLLPLPGRVGALLRLGRLVPADEEHLDVVSAAPLVPLGPAVFALAVPLAGTMPLLGVHVVLPVRLLGRVVGAARRHADVAAWRGGVLVDARRAILRVDRLLDGHEPLRLGRCLEELVPRQRRHALLLPVLVGLVRPRRPVCPRRLCGGGVVRRERGLRGAVGGPLGHEAHLRVGGAAPIVPRRLPLLARQRLDAGASVLLGPRVVPPRPRLGGGVLRAPRGKLDVAPGLLGRPAHHRRREHRLVIPGAVVVGLLVVVLPAAVPQGAKPAARGAHLLLVLGEAAVRVAVDRAHVGQRLRRPRPRPRRRRRLRRWLLLWHAGVHEMHRCVGDAAVLVPHGLPVRARREDPLRAEVLLGPDVTPPGRHLGAVLRAPRG